MSLNGLFQLLSMVTIVLLLPLGAMHFIFNFVEKNGPIAAKTRDIVRFIVFAVISSVTFYFYLKFTSVPTCVKCDLTGDALVAYHKKEILTQSIKYFDLVAFIVGPFLWICANVVKYIQTRPFKK